MPLLFSHRKQVELLGFNDLFLIPFGVLIIGFLVPILFFGKDLSEGFINYLPKWRMAAFYTGVYWLGGREIILRMRSQFPNSNQTVDRIKYQLLLSLAWILLVQMDSLVYGVGFGFRLEAVVDQPSFFQTFSASVLLMVFAITVYECVYMFKKYRESEIEQERLCRTNVQSQLDLLKSQINPHFLFNSLNTLTSIIVDDQKLAVEFVQKLSNNYRNILEHRNEKIILLADEIKALEAYVFLLKVRFQENLQVGIRIAAKDRQAWIIPMVLQMLLENAMKHNVVSSKRPLNIQVFVEGDQLIVRNNLQLKSQQISSTRLGLNNIHYRYKLLNNLNIHVEKSTYFFTVKIPLIRMDEQLEKQATEAELNVAAIKSYSGEKLTGYSLISTI